MNFLPSDTLAKIIGYTYDEGTRQTVLSRLSLVNSTFRSISQDLLFREVGILKWEEQLDLFIKVVPKFQVLRLVLSRPHDGERESNTGPLRRGLKNRLRMLQCCPLLQELELKDMNEYACWLLANCNLPDLKSLRIINNRRLETEPAGVLDLLAASSLSANVSPHLTAPFSLSSLLLSGPLPPKVMNFLLPSLHSLTQLESSGVQKSLPDILTKSQSTLQSISLRTFDFDAVTPILSTLGSLSSYTFVLCPEVGRSSSIPDKVQRWTSHLCSLPATVRSITLRDTSDIIASPRYSDVLKQYKSWMSDFLGHFLDQVIQRGAGSDGAPRVIYLSQWAKNLMEREMEKRRGVRQALKKLKVSVKVVQV